MSTQARVITLLFILGLCNTVIVTGSERVIGQANSLVKNAHWGAAIAKLKRAAAADPGNHAIKAALLSTEASWQREKRLLEDQILILDVKSIITRLKILKRLIMEEPNNKLYTIRLTNLEQLLSAKSSLLVSCSKYHQAGVAVISEICVELLSQTDRLTLKLPVRDNSGLSDELDAVDIEMLLNQARSSIDTGKYRDANSILQRAFGLAPQDLEVRGLIDQLDLMTFQRVEMLIKEGNQFYKEEKIDQAIVSWEEAVQLDPSRIDEIGGKLDRAGRVQQNLRELEESKASSE